MNFHDMTRTKPLEFNVPIIDIKPCL